MATVKCRQRFDFEVWSAAQHGQISHTAFIMLIEDGKRFFISPWIGRLFVFIFTCLFVAFTFNFTSRSFNTVRITFMRHFVHLELKPSNTNMVSCCKQSHDLVLFMMANLLCAGDDEPPARGY